ncbi:MAG: hypothetical protein DME75_04090 [Verrucomicrobia bacterium]|nr:MAG: hypothetical protein DME75_04090 [Verrucomicrobiota bacterium]
MDSWRASSKRWPIRRSVKTKLFSRILFVLTGSGSALVSRQRRFFFCSRESIPSRGQKKVTKSRRLLLRPKQDRHLPANLFPPPRRRLFTTRGTKDCSLPMLPPNRYAVFVIKRTRHGSGAIPPPARRFASLIRAKKSSSFQFPANDSPKTNNENMKTKLTATIATIVFFPIAGFGQPSPPPPPVPPSGPPDRHEKMPKVPVTFLGVETSEVPGVVSEQLGLPKGFGLVVDYVVPDGPAAAAGVQQNDIIKMLNDQILIDPNQLSKLVRSFSEGTTVTLTVLRKGQEQKIPVKLTKKEVHEHDSWLPRHRHGRDWNFNDLGDLGDQMRALKERLGDAQHDVIRDAVMTAHQAARHARDNARRAMDEVRILSNDDGALKTTKIDIGKAQIVFSDDKGEMKLETVDGKKLLTANDPQGKLLFSGPVETKEDVDKLPPEIRQRYEKLQQNHLPGVTPRVDADEDESADDDEEDEAPPMEQV